MKEIPEYPENRLDLCVDEQGNVTYRQNPVFAKYYAPTREEKEQELEDLKDRIRGFHLHNNDGVHDQHRRLGDGTIDFRRLLPIIRRKTPEANLVIEYTRPDLHGEPLCEDIAAVQSILREEPARKGGKEDAE